MTVSVVIPLYNKLRHIARAVGSVLSQSFSEFELIVVDDGSTDGSREVLMGIDDPRLRVITQPNQGVSAARNRGILEANHDLIAFLDADDEWQVNFLQTVLDLRQKFPDAGMYATAYTMCQGGNTWRPAFVDCIESVDGGLLADYFKSGLGPAPVWSSAVLIPRSVLKEVGMFPEGLSRGEDLHTWARIALKYRVAWSPQACAIYHLSADNRLCSSASTATDVPVAPVIEEFLRSGSRSPVANPEAMKEYIVRRRLQIVLSRHLQNRTALSRNLLEKTRDTRIFQKQRRSLLVLIHIPPWILRLLIKIKAYFRDRVGIDNQ